MALVAPSVLQAYRSKRNLSICLYSAPNLPSLSKICPRRGANASLKWRAKRCQELIAGKPRLIYFEMKEIYGNISAKRFANHFPKSLQLASLWPTCFMMRPATSLELDWVVELRGRDSQIHCRKPLFQLSPGRKHMKKSELMHPTFPSYTLKFTSNLHNTWFVGTSLKKANGHLIIL